MARNGHDAVTMRARTTKSQKLGWLMLATLRSGATVVMPRPSTLHAPPEPEVAFLVTAATRTAPAKARSDALIAVLAQLEARDRGLSA